MTYGLVKFENFREKLDNKRRHKADKEFNDRIDNYISKLKKPTSQEVARLYSQLELMEHLNPK